MKKTRRHTSKGIVEANVPDIAACTAVSDKDSVKRQFLAAAPMDGCQPYGETIGLEEQLR